MSATSNVYNVSGVQAGVQLINGACVLSGVTFVPTASSSSVIIYDSNTTDTGTILFKGVMSTVSTFGLLLPNIEVKLGVFVVQTGSSTLTTIYTH